MKIKKILSGVVAGTIALSTLSAMSMTTIAADETTKTLWSGSLWMNDKTADSTKNGGMNSVCITVLDGGDSDTEGSNGIQFPAYWEEGVKLVIDYESQETYKGLASKGTSLDVAFQVVTKVTDAWTWTEILSGAHRLELEDGSVYATYDCWDPEEFAAIIDETSADYDPEWESYVIPNVEFNADDTQVAITMTADDMCDGNEALSRIEAIQTMKEFDLKAQDVTVSSIALTGVYNEPVFNEYVDNGDGSYTYAYSGANADAAAIEANNANSFMNLSADVDYSKVTSISLDITANDWLTLQLGASDTVEQADGSYTWISKDATVGNDIAIGETATVTIETPNGIQADSALLKFSWFNANVKFTVSNIVFNVPEEEVSSEEEVVESSEVVEESSEVVEVSSVADSSSKAKSELEIVAPSQSKYVKYQLKDNGHTVRFVWIVDAEAVATATYGRACAGMAPDEWSDAERVLEDITKAYRTIYAGGTTVTAPEGYVYVISPTIENVDVDAGNEVIGSFYLNDERDGVAYGGYNWTW